MVCLVTAELNGAEVGGRGNDQFRVRGGAGEFEVGVEVGRGGNDQFWLRGGAGEFQFGVFFFARQFQFGVEVEGHEEWGCGVEFDEVVMMAVMEENGEWE